MKNYQGNQGNGPDFDQFREVRHPVNSQYQRDRVNMSHFQPNRRQENGWQ